MTSKEAAIKVIVGCCAAVAHEDVLLEIEHYKSWMRLPKKNKKAYKPLLDMADRCAKFEDLASVGLEQLQKVKE